MQLSNLEGLPSLSAEIKGKHNLICILDTEHVKQTGSSYMVKEKAILHLATDVLVALYSRCHATVTKYLDKS